MFAIASSTSQTWFASIISFLSGPISSLMMDALRASSSRSRPTFILTWPQPSATASRLRRLIFSSGYPSQPALVVYAGKPWTSISCSRSARGLVAPQDLERFLGRYRVGDVAEVHATHELLRAHVHEQLPEWLAFGFGVEVPDRVHYSGGSQVYDALLGADPLQLAVARHPAPEPPCPPRTTPESRRPRAGRGLLWRRRIARCPAR